MVVRFLLSTKDLNSTQRQNAVSLYSCVSERFSRVYKNRSSPPCFSFRTFSNFPCPLQSPNTISILGSYHLTPNAISDRNSRTSTDSANLYRSLHIFGVTIRLSYSGRDLSRIMVVKAPWLARETSSSERHTFRTESVREI